MTHCPNMNEVFLFLQPGWRTEKKTTADPGGRVRLLGQYSCSAQDPGGGTVLTVPPRRTILDDVSLAVEQSGEEPPLVSPGCSTVRTEKALAEDTRRWECPHDVVGLHAHQGTMRMSNDGVPLKNVESPYGGGVSPLLGAAGVCTPAMFPVAPALLAEGPQLGHWQVAVMRADETPGRGFFRTRFSVCCTDPASADGYI